MRYVTLRRNVVSEMLDVGRLAFEDADFQAPAMIEMNVHARDRDVVMIVIGTRQFLARSRALWPYVQLSRPTHASSSPS